MCNLPVHKQPCLQLCVLYVGLARLATISGALCLLLCLGFSVVGMNGVSPSLTLSLSLLHFLCLHSRTKTRAICNKTVVTVGLVRLSSTASEAVPPEHVAVGAPALWPAQDPCLPAQAAPHHSCRTQCPPPPQGEPNDKKHCTLHVRSILSCLHVSVSACGP